jgi:hypothetical protein
LLPIFDVRVVLLASFVLILPDLLLISEHASTQRRLRKPLQVRDLLHDRGNHRM